MKKGMWSRFAKSALAMAMALVLAAANLGTAASAASMDDVIVVKATHPSVVYGSLNGITTRGEVFDYGNSVGATTHFYSTSGTIRVMATIYYGSMNNRWHTDASSAAPIGSATATAKIPYNKLGSVPEGGQGTHSVDTGKHTWGVTSPVLTQFGSIYINSPEG